MGEGSAKRATRQLQRLLHEVADRVRADPSDFELRLRLADTLQALGRTADSITVYRGVVDAYARQGQLIQAIAVCKGILEIAPDHEETQGMLGRLAAPAYEAGARRAAKVRLERVGGRWIATPTTPGVAGARSAGDRMRTVAPIEDDRGGGGALGGGWTGEAPAAHRPDDSWPIAQEADEEDVWEGPRPLAAAADEPGWARALSPAEAEAATGDFPSAGFPRVRVERRDDTVVEAPPSGRPTPRGEAAAEAQEPRGPSAPVAADDSLELELEAELPDPRAAESGVQHAIVEPIAVAERAAVAIPLLSELPEAAIAELLTRLTVRRVRDGERILEEGEAGDACYVIVSGWARISKRTSDGEAEVTCLGPGSLFGEFALLNDQRRHASVAAIGAVELLEISRQTLRELIAHHPAVARALRRLYRDRLLETLIATAPLLRLLAPDDRAALAARFRSRRYVGGRAILEEGHAGGGLFLILLGEVSIVRRAPDGREVELAGLREGDYFGEMSLLSGDAVSATVRAARMTEVLHLPAPEFYGVVSTYPELWEEIRREAERREAENLALLGEARALLL